MIQIGEQMDLEVPERNNQVIKMGIELDEMITIKDVMKHLHISKNTAYKLIKLDTFPKIKIGRTYSIPVKEYKQWINKNIGKEIFI